MSVSKEAGHGWYNISVKSMYCAMVASLNETREQVDACHVPGAAAAAGVASASRVRTVPILIADVVNAGSLRSCTCCTGKAATSLDSLACLIHDVIPACTMCSPSAQGRSVLVHGASLKHLQSVHQTRFCSQRDCD
jgi:hypothetical protein